MKKDFTKYEAMQANGADIRQVYEAAKNDGFCDGECIVMLYTVFKMPFINAKRFVYEKDGRTLEEHQAELIEPLREALALEEIEQGLSGIAGVRVDVRGRGRSAFIYARSSERAVEVSVDENGYFVEYWDEADESSDAASVKSEIVSSSDVVQSNVRRWLV